jgi:ABC-2 type transport system ATP-binding protein
MLIVFMARFYDTDKDYLQDVVKCQSDFMAPWEVGIGALLSNWWNGALIFILICEFFPSDLFKAVVRFVSGFIVLLSLCFFPQIAQGIVGNLNGGTSVRAILMAVELGMMASFVFDRWRVEHFLKLDKKTRYSVIVGTIVLLMCTIGDYLPANLFGTHIGSLSGPYNFNMAHRIWLYLFFILPVVYYNLLYPFDKDHRRAFLFFISFAVFFSYAAVRRRQTFMYIYNAPLHLCNTAMYIMPFTLAFSNYFLFYFTMFVNVIGAFLAMMMPNYASSIPILSSNAIEFFTNHLYAAFMPVLIILLGIYQRPKIKYFFYSMIGFLLYFVTVAFINIYYDAVANLGLDFFFLNSSFISDKLGAWAQNIFNDSTNIQVGKYTLVLRPLYLFLYYLIYVGLSLGMWYVYEMLFLALDQLTILRVRRAEEKNGRTVYMLTQEEEKETMTTILKYRETQARVDIEGLTKTYPGGTKPAVKDFTVHLRGGKIYGFLGKNGAGKSTLIKAIVGIHSFEKGTILVCGFDVVYEPIKAKLCLGYVPDNYALYENLTGRQYIQYIASIYKVSKANMEERASDLVKRLELTEVYDQPISSYSHGMKQKITIIGALVHAPKIWILDEPMTGLDPASIFQIKETMREYAKKGNIVFFSSHIIDVVKNLCDNIIIIKDGQLVEQKDMADYEKNNIDLEQHFLEVTADSQSEADYLKKELKENR